MPITFPPSLLLLLLVLNGRVDFFGVSLDVLAGRVGFGLCIVLDICLIHAQQEPFDRRFELDAAPYCRRIGAGIVHLGIHRVVATLVINTLPLAHSWGCRINGRQQASRVQDGCPKRIRLLFESAFTTKAVRTARMECERATKTYPGSAPLRPPSNTIVTRAASASTSMSSSSSSSISSLSVPIPSSSVSSESGPPTPTSRARLVCP